MHALLVLLQAAATTHPVPVTPPAKPPERIDLSSLAPAPCREEDDGGDIVVCARRHADRLPAAIAKAGPPDRPPLTIRLPGGGTGNLRVVDTSLPGAHDSAAVVTLKTPF